MAIIGIGTDIVEVGRIRRNERRWGERFLQRIFTALELEYCSVRVDPCIHLSGKFAGKEAVFKALSTFRERNVGWKDIEIGNDDNNRPMVKLRGRAAEVAAENGVGNIYISVSHERETAIAFAVTTDGA